MDIDMDIKELEAFVYVVENCSFSRAAELLHLTQPTISSHISALERKLGIKLVVRTTSLMPSLRSSAEMWEEMVGCVRCSSSAAREKLQFSTT